jgi:superfamily II DNA or RNA helicase
MTCKLRPYQQEAVERAEIALDSGKSPLIILPTGTGKTVVVSVLTKQTLVLGRTLVIAHTEELVSQMANTLHKICDVDVGIEMGDRSCTPGSGSFTEPSIVVASRQSMANPRRLNQWPEDWFARLIIDEAHHCVPKCTQYRVIIERFCKRGRAALLGVTATPDRTDKESVGQFFDCVAYEATTTEMQAEGYLVPVQQSFVTVNCDFSRARNKQGDFNDQKLDQILASEPEVAHEIALAASKTTGQTLIFCPGVELAKLVSQIVNRFDGDAADWVTGETHKDRRREIVSAFRRGDLRCLVGCMVFTEGFDAPETVTLLNARPTKSRSLYAQIAGRIMRPWPGVLEGLDTKEERLAAIAASPKQFGIIHDLTTAGYDHELVFSGDILGGKVSNTARQRAIEEAKAANGPVDLARLLQQQEAKFREEQAEIARRKAMGAIPDGDVDYHDRPVTSIDHQRMPTQQMRDLLARNGYDSDGMTYAQAALLIRDLKKSWDGTGPTPKQKKVLERAGLPTDVTKTVASVFIDILVGRKWRPFDYTPSREMLRIRRDEDGKYRVNVIDPDFGPIALGKEFNSVDECRQYYGPALDQMPSLV